MCNGTRGDSESTAASGGDAGMAAVSASNGGMGSVAHGAGPAGAAGPDTAGSGGAASVSVTDERATNDGTGGTRGGSAGVGNVGPDPGVAGGAAGGAAGAAVVPPPAVTPEPIDEAAYLFDPAQVRTYDILVTQTDLDSINQQPGAESWVPASLLFEGTTYGPYRVRYKGAAGAFMHPCTSGPPDGPKAGKCSMKLGFNEVDPNGRFFGLKKLNLHSMNADPSMLRDRLGYTMFRDMGVAAPRAVHARVLINGQLEGLFAVVEQVDGRFTRARFGEGGKGNLYKEIWPSYDDPSVYLAALETNENQQPSVQRMLDFKQAIDTGALDTVNLVDRDYILRYLAVDRVTVNDDGIMHLWCDHTAQGNNRGSWGNHNYYWYEALNENRFWLIPWDLDNAFDGTPFVHLDPAWTAAAACMCTTSPSFGIQAPASCDPLIQHFASWLGDYEKKVDELIMGPFAQARVDALLNVWTTQIQPAVNESAGLNRAPSEAAWADAVLELKTKIDSARIHRGYAY